VIQGVAQEDRLSQTSAVALHAAARSGVLVIWGESGTALLAGERGGGPAHPFAAGGALLLECMRAAGLEPDAFEHVDAALRLPVAAGSVVPSAALARSLGKDRADYGEPDALDEVEAPTIQPAVERWDAVLDALLEAEDEDRAGGRIVCGPSIRFFSLLTALGRHLLAQQRFVPMLLQDRSGNLSAAWRPWLSDEATANKVTRLVQSMPLSARAAVDELDHDPWRIVEAYLGGYVDGVSRSALRAESMSEVVEDLDPDTDVQIGWASALLGDGDAVPATPAVRSEASRRVRRWIGELDDRGRSSSWRLLLRVNEPIMPEAAGEDDAPPTGIETPGEEVEWSLSFHLQSQDNEEIILDAADVWSLSRDSVTIQGLTLDQPQELMLGELGRASRIYKRLESALDESEPIEVLLKTEEAYQFLREYRPLLREQGFAVESPGWWESPAGRLGTRLKIDSDPVDAMLGGGGSAAASSPQLGLGALVGYHWEIAVGDTTLTLHEFEQLANKGTPLVRVNGRWVEIRPEDVKAAVKFIGENPGGEMQLSEAMRLAYTADTRETGLPVLGLDASGWVASLLGMGDGAKKSEGEEGAETDETQRIDLGGVSVSVPTIETPPDFRGTLRPYQLRGLSWLAFLEQFGFGACLADDMGLGKTIQVLALLLHEKDRAAEAGKPSAPTLLIAPMSVIGNWRREAERFTPRLNVLVHHGVDRLADKELIDAASEHDVTVTTYALANRDHETLSLVPWHRVVIDEAQFIKNPQAKQSQAVRGMRAERRIALTGTPVENRLSELWSIMDFLNPGYLGSPSGFRRRFSVPIERHRDQHRSAQLRGLVRPFVLRRVKTDPTVVADLPEKLETREYTHLTSEQAQLYESCVKRMLSDVEEADGITRRGKVLAALIRLKQICNHPSQVLKDHGGLSGSAPSPARSGKCRRLIEMVDEVLAEGERVLVFTQFRQMGELLAGMLRHELGEDVLFLHGGTAKTAREKMVDDFQDPKSKKPILILSLKAGGVGLNLTAATHVFHFDRWWNPAVENQATDRAYRIGQTRTVQVHKFVVRGTLEERIDEMIESKTELAENIIGQGERWLTDLDSDQLRDILTLRADAIGDEE